LGVHLHKIIPIGPALGLGLGAGPVSGFLHFCLGLPLLASGIAPDSSICDSYELRSGQVWCLGTRGSNSSQDSAPDRS
ncbi:hypothetical protein LINPERPRIM_LOCUS21046, partial [Linum perenne]